MFSIAPIHIAELDLRILQSLCALTSNRARSYIVAKVDQLPEAYLVDLNLPDSVREWEARQIYHPATVVVISKTLDTTLSPYVLKRPLIPSRLLTLLDNLSA